MRVCRFANPLFLPRILTFVLTFSVYYLKNGTGNYYIEAQTRDQTRTDVIIDYLGQQYIIELKIWRGERYNAEGEKQIIDYLNHWHLDTGYDLEKAAT